VAVKVKRGHSICHLQINMSVAFGGCGFRALIVTDKVCLTKNVHLKPQYTKTDMFDYS